MSQMLHRFDLDLSEEQYLRFITDKTAILYGASSELGAAYADAEDSTVAACRDFGLNLGLAFQIVDDCLDVEGEESVVGKSLGTDFGRGKLTLPFLRVLRGLDGDRRRRFREIFENVAQANGSLLDKQAALAAEFDLASGLAYAHARADHYLKAATRCLRGLPDNEYVEALRCMAEFVLLRRS
jgi:octaprenyl-diphosphate synthase